MAAPIIWKKITTAFKGRMTGGSIAVEDRMRNVALDLKKAEVFSAVIDGLPRVVELITTLPFEKRPAALAAAQQSYLQTAQTLGYRETEAQQWASKVVSILENEMCRKFISGLNSQNPRNF